MIIGPSLQMRLERVGVGGGVPEPEGGCAWSGWACKVHRRNPIGTAFRGREDRCSGPMRTHFPFDTHDEWEGLPIMKMAPLPDDRARSVLIKRFEREQDAVLADPLWRTMRTADPDFLDKLPKAFRLELLRFHFTRHPENPWLVRGRSKRGNPNWPEWAAPIWKYSRDGIVDSREEGRILGERMPLALGWSFCFSAGAAEVYFEMVDSPDDTRFPLDVVLSRLFLQPDADPREALCNGHTDLLMPCDGADISFEGVRVYRPDGGELETDDDNCFFFEGSTNADQDLIRSLSSTGAMYQRKPEADDEPRPLFALAPTIDEYYLSEGRLRCSWKTEYFLPTDLGNGADSPWTYQRWELNVQTVLQGMASHDLVGLAWKYQRMSDLKSKIANAICSPRAHAILRPIYEQVLFGGH